MHHRQRVGPVRVVKHRASRSQRAAREAVEAKQAQRRAQRSTTRRPCRDHDYAQRQKLLAEVAVAAAAAAAAAQAAAVVVNRALRRVQRARRQWRAPTIRRQSRHSAAPLRRGDGAWHRRRRHAQAIQAHYQHIVHARALAHSRRAARAARSVWTSRGSNRVTTTTTTTSSAGLGVRREPQRGAAHLFLSPRGGDSAG